MTNEGDTMPGTAVEQVEAQDLAERRHLNQVIRTADVMAASSLCRKDLRGKPEDVRAIAITLDQMGIPPGIMNINAGFVVNGRVDFMTKIWTALAQRGGYKVWPDDASDSHAGIAWIRDVATGEEHRVTFTWEDAAKASLTGSDTYKKYGRDMLIWRAMARAVRWHAPEVVAGMVEFDDTPVARPRPRPIPGDPDGYVPAAGRHYPETDDGDGCDIVDAEIVEQGEDTQMAPAARRATRPTQAEESDMGPSGDAQPATPGSSGDEQDEVYANRRRRANAVMGEVGVKADDARHQLVHTATGGATESTGRLTAWQVEAVVDFCDRLKMSEGGGTGTHQPPASGATQHAPSGQSAPADRDNAAEQVVAAAVPGPLPGEWRARAAEQGVTDGQLLIMARDVAGALGVAQPQSLKDVTDEVAAGVLEQLG
jgi:hypothetical protein